MDAVGEYVGDQVYVDNDNYHLILRVHDGMNLNEEIFLDPRVLQEVIKYCKEKGLLK